MEVEAGVQERCPVGSPQRHRLHTLLPARLSLLLLGFIGVKV